MSKMGNFCRFKSHLEASRFTLSTISLPPPSSRKVVKSNLANLGLQVSFGELQINLLYHCPPPSPRTKVENNDSSCQNWAIWGLKVPVSLQPRNPLPKIPIKRLLFFNILIKSIDHTTSEKVV